MIDIAEVQQQNKRPVKEISSMGLLNNKKGVLSIPNPAILNFKSRCLIRKLNLGLGDKFKVNKDETPGTILYSLKHRVPPDESDKKFF